MGKYISLPVVITLILVILKLCGIITCSWWWVFCLLWIPVAISLLSIFIGCTFLVLLIIFLFIILIIESFKEWK